MRRGLMLFQSMTNPRCVSSISWLSILCKICRGGWFWKDNFAAVFVILTGELNWQILRLGIYGIMPLRCKTFRKPKEDSCWSGVNKSKGLLHESYGWVRYLQVMEAALGTDCSTNLRLSPLLFWVYGFLLYYAEATTGSVHFAISISGEYKVIPFHWSERPWRCQGNPCKAWGNLIVEFYSGVLVYKRIFSGNP